MASKRYSKKPDGLEGAGSVSRNSSRRDADSSVPHRPGETSKQGVVKKAGLRPADLALDTQKKTDKNKYKSGLFFDLPNLAPPLLQKRANAAVRENDGLGSKKRETPQEPSTKRHKVSETTKPQSSRYSAVAALKAKRYKMIKPVVPTVFDLPRLSIPSPEPTNDNLVIEAHTQDSIVKPESEVSLPSLAKNPGSQTLTKEFAFTPTAFIWPRGWKPNQFEPESIPELPYLRETAVQSSEPRGEDLLTQPGTPESVAVVENRDSFVAPLTPPDSLATTSFQEATGGLGLGERHSELADSTDILTQTDTQDSVPEPNQELSFSSTPSEHHFQAELPDGEGLLTQANAQELTIKPELVDSFADIDSFMDSITLPDSQSFQAQSELSDISILDKLEDELAALKADLSSAQVSGDRDTASRLSFLEIPNLEVRIADLKKLQSGDTTEILDLTHLEESDQIPYSAAINTLQVNPAKEGNILISINPEILKTLEDFPKMLEQIEKSALAPVRALAMRVCSLRRSSKYNTDVAFEAQTFKGQNGRGPRQSRTIGTWHSTCIHVEEEWSRNELE